MSDRIIISSAIFSRILIFLCILFYFLVLSDFKLFTWVFTHWDASYYLGIAQYWYPPFLHPNWAFLPFFPSILRIFFLITRNLLFTEVFGLIFNACIFVLSLHVLHNLAQSRNKTKKYNYIVSAFFPTTVFCSFIYTESLFLLLVLLTFLFFIQEKYKKSLISSFLAGFTRPNGVFLSIIYLYARKPLKEKILMFIIPFLPLLLFNVYGYILTGVFPVTEISRMTFWPDNHPVSLHSKLQHAIYSLHIVFFQLFICVFSIQRNIYLIIVNSYLLIFTTFVLILAIKSINLENLKRMLTFSPQTPKRTIVTCNAIIILVSFALSLIYGNPYSILRYLLPFTLVAIVHQKPIKKIAFVVIIFAETIFLILLAIIYLDGHIFIG